MLIIFLLLYGLPAITGIITGIITGVVILFNKDIQDKLSEYFDKDIIVVGDLFKIAFIYLVPGLNAVCFYGVLLFYITKTKLWNKKL